MPKSNARRCGIGLCAAAFLGGLLFAPGISRANFLDTIWKITEFKGEAWYLAPEAYMGQSQEFYKGFAEGIFFNCDGGGLSKTYIEYSREGFFEQP